MVTGNGFYGLRSDHILLHADDTRTRASSASTVRHVEYDIDAETVRGFPVTSATGGSFSTQGVAEACSPTAPSTVVQSHQGVANVEHSSVTRSTSKGKEKLIETPTDDAGERKPPSPRKSIPTFWRGPTLATAQRALQRESRKKALQGESPTSPTENSRKSIRSARSIAELGVPQSTEPTTFLTKDAIAAVESNITSPSSSQVLNTLRHATSKATLITPMVSPMRDSLDRQSTIKSTVSPTRTSQRSSHNLDELNHPMVAGCRRRAHAPSSIPSADGSPYVTARHSPVSQRSSGYVTAQSEPDVDDDVSDLALADSEDYEQMSKALDGTRLHLHSQSQGKPEPHAKASIVSSKATSTKPLAPKLSLRIPCSSTLSTDRKSPLALESASSSGSGTSASHSHHSRIPRISATVKAEQHSSVALNRTKSAKSPTSRINGLQHTHATAFQDSPKAVPTSDGDKNMASTDRIEPHNIPLPVTPTAATAPLRHVKTHNSKGTTPILSDNNSKPVANDESPVDCRTASGERALSLGTTSAFIHRPLSRDTIHKRSMVESYLDTTVPLQHSKEKMSMEEEPATTISPEPLSTPPTSNVANILLKCMMAEPESGNQESVLGGEIRSQASRVASIASEATVKASSIGRDPIMRDSAIIYSRRKSDTSGTSLGMLNSTSPIACIMAHSNLILETSQSDPTHDESTSVTSASIGSSSAPSAQHNTSPSRGRTHQYIPHDRRQTHSEFSLQSSLTSELRPDAAVFVPRQHTAQVPDRPCLPEEWKQPQQVDMPFNPFELGVMDSIPLYYHMYPVHVGPGTPFDFSNFGPRHSPSKKGKSKKHTSNAKIRRQNNRNNNRGSLPAISVQIEDNTLAPDKSATQEKGDTTPRQAPVVPPRSEDREAEEELDHEIKSDTEGEGAFMNQIEAVTRHVTERNERGTGRGSRRIDWSSIRNVPCQPQHSQATFNVQYDPQDVSTRAQDVGAFEYVDYGHNTLPLSQQQHRSRRSNYPRQTQPAHPNNALYDNYYPGSYRNQNWNMSAGVPLESTAPFPNPVAPPGPRPTGGEGRMAIKGGDSKEYIGYSIGEKKTCEHIVIEDAKEWGGQVCNNCDRGHQTDNGSRARL